MARGNEIKAKNSAVRAFTLVETLVLAGILGLVCAVTLPNLARARTTAQKTGCVENLQKIEWAKQQWALETGKGHGAEPAKSDLLSYLKSWPACPAGGIYEIGGLEVRPRCVIIHAEP